MHVFVYYKYYLLNILFKKMAKESAIISSNKGRITFQISSRFNDRYYSGFKGCKHIYYGADSNPKNDREARKTLLQLIDDLEDGTFDPNNISKYKYQDKQKVTPNKSLPTVSKIFNDYCDFISKNNLIEQTTYISKYKRYRLIFNESPQDINHIPVISKYMWNLNKGLHSRFKIVGALILAFEWSIKNEEIPKSFEENIGILKNDLNTLKGIIKKQKPRTKSRYIDNNNINEEFKGFTSEEMELIIKEFYERYLKVTKKRKTINQLPYFIEFVFRTGVRIGEGIALTWGDISQDCNTVTINKSYSNVIWDVKGTKTGENRTFPVSTKTRSLLISIRPDNYKNDELVFKNMAGKYICQGIIHHSWLGRERDGTFYDGVVKQLVDKRLVKYYLKPYAMRATFVTQQILKGVNPVVIAKWTGHNVKTLLEYYESVRGSDATPLD